MTCYTLIELATIYLKKTSVLYKHVVDLYIARLQALRLSAARAPNPPLKRRQRSQYHRCSAGGQQTNDITQGNAYRLLATYRSGFRTLSVALHVSNQCMTKEGRRKLVAELRLRNFTIFSSELHTTQLNKSNDPMAALQPPRQLPVHWRDPLIRPLQ